MLNERHVDIAADCAPMRPFLLRTWNPRLVFILLWHALLRPDKFIFGLFFDWELAFSRYLWFETLDFLHFNGCVCHALLVEEGFREFKKIFTFESSLFICTIILGKLENSHRILQLVCLSLDKCTPFLSSLNMQTQVDIPLRRPNWRRSFNLLQNTFIHLIFLDISLLLAMLSRRAFLDFL